jgi:hypothetical protein
MAFAFDTLGYAKHLREHGVPQDHAEAHAEAARQFIMTELVTRNDLAIAIDGLRREIENQTLRITIRMGVMLAAGLSILAAIQRLH